MSYVIFCHYNPSNIFARAPLSADKDLSLFLVQMEAIVNLLIIIIIINYVLYGSVSQGAGLGATKFMNLIGRNGY